MIKFVDNAVYIGQRNGKSHYEFNCPFCGNKIVLYVWRGIKHCNCGAKCSTIFNGKYRLNISKE